MKVRKKSERKEKNFKIIIMGLYCYFMIMFYKISKDYCSYRICNLYKIMYFSI